MDAQLFTSSIRFLAHVDNCTGVSVDIQLSFIALTPVAAGGVDAPVGTVGVLAFVYVIASGRHNIHCVAFSTLHAGLSVGEQCESFIAGADNLAIVNRALLATSSVVVVTGAVA
jgi:hypothetical protein